MALINFEDSSQNLINKQLAKGMIEINNSKTCVWVILNRVGKQVRCKFQRQVIDQPRKQHRATNCCD